MLTVKPGDIFGTEVRIQLTAVTSTTLQARVVETTDHWASRGLVMDRELILEPTGHPDTWRLADPELPWFLLDDQGFEHYMSAH